MTEEKTDIRVFVFKGMLFGVIIGSTCGFLESILVTLTGFNIPLAYSAFVYGFDLLAGSLIGAFWGLVVGILVQ